MGDVRVNKEKLVRRYRMGKTWSIPQVSEIEVKMTEKVCYNKIGCEDDGIAPGIVIGELTEIACPS